MLYLYVSPSLYDLGKWRLMAMKRRRKRISCCLLFYFFLSYLICVNAHNDFFSFFYYKPAAFVYHHVRWQKRGVNYMGMDCWSDMDKKSRNMTVGRVTQGTLVAEPLTPHKPISLLRRRECREGPSERALKEPGSSPGERATRSGSKEPPGSATPLERLSKWSTSHRGPSRLSTVSF